MYKNNTIPEAFQGLLSPSSEEDKLKKNIKGQHIQYIQRKRAYKKEKITNFF